MKRFIIAFLTVFYGVGFIFSGLTFVYAQDTDDMFTLEEITVTAEKREVNVQDSALSVTAISGEDIRDRAQNSLENILRDVAAVSIGGANRGGNITIRGVGSYVDTSLADPAVAVIEDNVYNGNSLTVFNGMYDLERVEVLRGPQGTLYGRNATGGTINVVTKKPIHDFELLGNFQIGDYNLQHFDGAVNFPLSDAWAGRVAVLREVRDGYLSSGDNDSNNFSVRGRLLFEPNEKLSVLATIDHYWERTKGGNTVPISGSAGNMPSFLGWTVPDVDNDGVADDFIDENGDPYPNGIPDIVDTGWELPAGADEWTNDEYHPAGSLYAKRTTYSMQIDWEMGWGVLTAIPSYSDSYNHNIDDHLTGLSMSTDGTIGDGQIRTRKQTTGELRLASKDGAAFEWIAGYYYMRSENTAPDMEEDPLIASEEEGGGWEFVTYYSPEETNALFGQATVPLTDRFRVTGGIRYSQDDQSKDYRYANANVDPSEELYAETDGTGVFDSGLLHYEQSVSSTTYRAGVEFDATEGSMLYAQISTGFKQGGLNRGAPPYEFEPEELVAYELGSKNRFLENRLQMNMEVYYYNYDNLQAQASQTIYIGDTGDTANMMAILNAEEGTNKGAEIEIDYLLTQNDRVIGSIAYSKAEYGTFILPANVIAGTTEPFDMTGRPVSWCPEWSGTLAYEHSWLLDNGASVTGRVDTKISDGYYATVEQYLAGAWQESYTKSNANVTYSNPEGTWSTSVWIKNIENDAQKTWVPPFYRAMVTDPRTFGLSVSFRY